MHNFFSKLSVPALLLTIILSVTSASAQDTLPVPVTAAELCAPCHTVEGIGKDNEIPNLAGQHATYLYNQIKAFKSGARKHIEMKFISRELSESEMRDLAEFYASLPSR